MPLKRLSEEEIKEKLHRRKEIRNIVAQRGLTDILKIDPKFMRTADGLPEEEEETHKAPQSKWKRGAKIVMSRFVQVSGSAAGASYLATNAANVAGAPGLAYGYFAGGATGFLNSVPSVVEQGKNTVESWSESSAYERYKNIKGMLSGVNGLAGNTRNTVVQSADGFAGVTWNTPGYTFTESGVNPAQLEADIGFNIINNALVAIGGGEQIYESYKKKKNIKDVSFSIRDQQISGVEGIKEVVEDPRLTEIIDSFKGPNAKIGSFIPALTKMQGIVEDLHEREKAEGKSEERLEQLKEVKKFLQDNMDSYEETEKLVRSNAMAMKQENIKTACGAYDIVKGSVCVAAISTRFISSPMGGIAGLVDGVTGIVGNAALKGQFFGLEELWDNKSVLGQRNKRQSAAREVDAAICLYGDRDYNVKSATKQLVQDVIKDYNERNPETPLPGNGDTKRSVASKVYYEMGSIERSKAGLGNNAMLIRAAELRMAALQEPSENGPYHWCVKSMGFDCKNGEVPSVSQIAHQMGCNRDWRDLVKKDEIDKKEQKWARKQAQSGEDSSTKEIERREEARADIDHGLENTTPKRKFGRQTFMNRKQLEAEDEALNVKNPIKENTKSKLAEQPDIPKLPDVPTHEPGELDSLLAKNLPSAAEGRSKSVRLFSKEELSELGLGARPKQRPVQKSVQKSQDLLKLPDVPTHEPGEISKKESEKKPLRKRQMI